MRHQRGCWVSNLKNTFIPLLSDLRLALIKFWKQDHVTLRYDDGIILSTYFANNLWAKPEVHKKVKFSFNRVYIQQKIKTFSSFFPLQTSSFEYKINAITVLTDEKSNITTTPPHVNKRKLQIEKR
ncbi:hypothetical protein CHUAL_013987 [Chamberlinius hualienensis]